MLVMEILKLLVSAVQAIPTVKNLLPKNEANQQAQEKLSNLEKDLLKIQAGLKEILSLPKQLVSLKDIHHKLTGVVSGYPLALSALEGPLNKENWGDLRDAWNGGILGNSLLPYKQAEAALGSFLSETTLTFGNHGLAEAYKEATETWKSVDTEVKKSSPNRKRIRDGLGNLKTVVERLLALVDVELKTCLETLHEAAMRLPSS